MSNIKDTLDNLTSEDVYSLMLFSLYALKDNPEYKVLSELIYLLDKDSLLKLIRYFGGQTIELPTLKELKLAANCLLLVQYVNCEGMEFEEASKLLKLPSSYKLEDVRKMYIALQETLSKYSFGGR